MVVPRERDNPDRIVSEGHVGSVPGDGRVATRSVSGIPAGVPLCAMVRVLGTWEDLLGGTGGESADSSTVCSDPSQCASDLALQKRPWSGRAAIRRKPGRRLSCGIPQCQRRRRDGHGRRHRHIGRGDAGRPGRGSAFGAIHASISGAGDTNTGNNGTALNVRVLKLQLLTTSGAFGGACASPCGRRRAGGEPPRPPRRRPPGPPPRRSPNRGRPPGRPGSAARATRRAAGR
ncbi:MAG: Uncharacterized protein JWR37_4322 [Mycobacterium sp.]|nr:Uncharacterized protein [Mycobacterium sp.]